MFAIALTSISVTIVYLLTQEYLEKKRCKIPGPPSYPFVGSYVEVSKNFDRILDWHVEMTKKYGETWSFKFLGQPRRIFTSNPLNVEYILKKNFENYEKGDAFKDRFHDLLGDGIFNVDGEKWRFQRKTASNIFNVKNFRDNMCHVFVEHGKKVLALLDSLKPGEAINMHDLFHRYTLDSIGEIAFGLNIGSIEDPTVPFASAFDFCQIASFQRFASPIWRLNKLFSSKEALFRKNLDILNKYCKEVIENRRKEANQDRRDLLSLFLGKEDGQNYDDNFLRDLMMNFIIAGRDTTAQNLSWTFYLLSQTPRVEEKLINEVDEMFGRSEPSYEDIKKMKYGHAVVSESLRLYPSVPKDIKWSSSEDVLPDGTKIPAKCFVGYLPYTMARLESNWGKDCEEFKPERWFEEGEENLKKRDDGFSYKYAVFQAGPRMCLGQDMALLEAKTLITMILQKYKLRLVPGQNITYQNNVTLPMVNASMMMTVEKRED